ncbi:cytochrome P450 [Plantactinospora sp. WMMB334]|uniref:cytochrome P450 n=1 Tax=Plantactinospora sp. WMMB334 TaxID=3404119 RepID=UPI003B94315C
MTPGLLDGDLSAIDLADPETFVRSDTDEMWRRFRTEAPVHLHPETGHGPPFWVLSRHADVRAFYQDDERFSSHHGNMLTSLHKPHGDPAAGMMLALTDAPRHSAMRAILVKAFSPRSRELIVNRLQDRVDALLREAAERREVDFARDVAERVSMGTICDLIGIPAADHDMLLGLSREALSSDEADQTDEQAWAARNELLLYCQDVADERRRRPTDDLMGAMASCVVDGRPMTIDELVVNCYGLILAGDQTSRLAMVGGVLALTGHPEQWESLGSGRVRMATAVDEVLRWTTPVMHVGRIARTDVRVGGHTVRKGDIVTGWNTSANRDAEVFADPDTFDLGRAPNPHLSLGYGPHFCFGAYLGRAEVGAVLTTLRRTVDSVQSRGEPTPLYSTFLRGYGSLPVELIPKRGRASS